MQVDEFALALKKKGSAIPEEEVARLMMEADINGDGTIDYEVRWVGVRDGAGAWAWLVQYAQNWAVSAADATWYCCCCTV